MNTNEILGNITRLIMSLLDYRVVSDNQLAADMADLELTWEILRSEKRFIHGVFNGFIWEASIEQWFKSALDTRQDSVYLDITSSETDSIPENVDILLHEVDAEETVGEVVTA
jgi:hypothetical protein